MFKKLYKGLYLLLFVMFVTGSFCLFPSLKGVAVKAAESNVSQTVEQDLPPEVLPTAKWSELWKTTSGGLMNGMSLGSGSSSAISNIHSENINDIHVISSASQLAEAAYLINSNADYRDDIFIIEPANATIDLGEALWTPIGTAENPFTGVFYGNGATIKNIAIEDIVCEKSHAGLFGSISGASITDIRLGGYQTISVSENIGNTSTKRNAGALVGTMTNSYIINCHDELTSKTCMIGADTPSTNYEAIGSSSGSYIFRSAMYNLNGSTANAIKGDINNITVKGNTGFTTGYVTFYYAGEGKFYINNPRNDDGVMVEWPDHGGKVVRVLVNSDCNLMGTALNNQKAKLYRSEYITLRTDAGKNDVFVLRQGFKANNYNVFKNDYSSVREIGYTAAKMTVNLQYGYGSRDTTLTFDYDQSFRSFFENPNNNGYIKRTGYTFANLKEVEENADIVKDAVTDKVLDSNQHEIVSKSSEPLYYKASFPDDGYTYKFNWTMNGTRSFEVKFAYASDEGGLILNDFNAGSYYSSFLNGVTKLTESVGGGKGFKIVGLTDDSASFEITLNPGYRISTNTSNITDFSVSANKANQLSGAYPDFNSLTGEGGAYSDANTNNDYYNKVATSVKWDNESDYNEATIQTGKSGQPKVYTITVKNLVSANAGIVYIVIERDFVSIDLTPVNVDAADIKDTAEINQLKYHFESSDLKSKYDNNEFKKAYLEYLDGGVTKIYNAVKGTEGACQTLNENNNPVLQIRYKESISDIKFIEQDRYLLNKDSSNIANNEAMSFNRAEETTKTGQNVYFDTPIDETQSSFAKEYYRGWTLQFSNMLHSYNKLTIYVGSLKTMVNIQFYRATSDGDKVEMTDGLEGVGIYFQSSPNANQNVSNHIIQMAETDQIYVSRNGNYQVKYIYIHDLSKVGSAGEDPNKVVLSCGETGIKFGEADGNANSSLNANNYYLGSYLGSGDSRIFKNAYSNMAGESNVNYRVEVVLEERVHDLQVEYYVDGKLIDNNNYKTFFLDACPSTTLTEKLPTALAGSNYSFTYRLNSVGQGSLIYSGYEIYLDKFINEDAAMVSNASGTNTSESFRTGEGFGRDGFELTKIENLKTVGASGSFDVKLGGYETVIKINFSFKTGQKILINKLFDDGEDKLISENADLLNNVTFKGLTYEFDGTNLTLRNTTSLENISIHSQYYLLGWYLTSSGVTVIGNYGGFLSDKNFVTAVAEHYATSESAFDGIAAFVAKREVSVSYYTSDAEKGYGQIYDKNLNIIDDLSKKDEVFREDAFNVTYGEEHEVNNNIFYNIGYTFGKYKPTRGGMVEGSNSYKIDLKEWALLFNAGTGSGFKSIDTNTFMQQWDSVVNRDDLETQTQYDINQMIAYVELHIDWNIINYYANIDGENGISANGENILSIGDTITYETKKDDKNGLATYLITDPTKTTPDRIAGVITNGYIVKGIKVTHKDDHSSKELLDAEWDNGKGSFVLTPEVLRIFLREDCYFQQNTNDDKIKFETLLDPAEYYIELVNSPENYYTYKWNARDGSNAYGYTVIENSKTVIRIKVTYGYSSINLTEAKRLGYLEVERLGYSHTGWAFASDGEDVQSTKHFDPAQIYNSDYIGKYSDTKVVPTWAPLTTKATTSQLDYDDNVGSLRSFYLLTSYDIAKGSVGCSNPTTSHLKDNTDVSVNRILGNGERITGYKYEVTLNGRPVELATFENNALFNIENLVEAGVYKVVFRLYIEDSLTKIDANGKTTKHTYEQVSDTLTFEMLKNELFFYDHDLKTVYNGTNKFVEADSNVFGKVKLRYEWNGEEKADGSLIGDTDQYFDTVDGIEVVGSGDALDVGTGKSLKIKFDLNRFSQKFGDKLYENLLTDATYNSSLKSDNTISKVENDYFVTFTDALEIEKAVFTIEFPSGAAYYFKGVEVVAYTNFDGTQQKSYQFSIGEVKPEIFSFTFSQITLIPTDGDTAVGNYQGKANHIEDAKIFKVHDLAIYKNNVAEKLSNFEWIISESSLFRVMPSGDALGLNYTTKYLTAQNGVLNELNETYTYNGETKQDTLYLSNLIVDGKAYELKSLVDGEVKIDIKGNQGSVYINNMIVLSFVGNNTEALQIIVDKDALNKPDRIKYDVNIDISNTRKSQLKLLEFVEDSLVDTAKVSNKVFNENISKLFDDGVDNVYLAKVSLPSETYTNKHNIYAILTDAVKVEIDFNNKAKAEDSDKQTVYVSLTGGTFRITNPTHEDGAYLKFNGYMNSLATDASNIKVEETLGPGDCAFSNKAAGSTERIKAKWEFTNFKFDITDGVIDTAVDSDETLYASASEILYPLAKFMEIDAPKIAELVITMTSTTKFGGDGVSRISFVYVPDQKAFRFVDWNGQASVKLNDTYNVSVTYSFNDNASGKVQTLNIVKEVELALSRNTIEIDYKNTELTFRNSNQENKVNVDIYLNGETSPSQTTILSLVPDTAIDGNALHFHAVVKDSKGEEKLNQAGTYTVVNTIDANMVDVYQFVDGNNNPIYEKNVTINIAKYEIELSKYVSKFEPTNIEKYFGQKDQNPIYQILEISDDLDVAAQVQVNFGREDSEAIGTHRLEKPVLTTDADNNNYIIVDKDTFEAYYTIKTPAANLQIELGDKLTYVYNGRAVSEYNITYNKATKKYNLTIVAGEDSDTIEFDIYYKYGTEKIYVPETQKDIYAGYLTFTSNSAVEANLDGYTLTVSLKQVAIDDGWENVAFDNETSENAKIIVTKRDLKVTAIEKTYDGSTSFVYNTVSTNGNTCAITFRAGDIVSYANGSIDEIQLSGEFAGPNNGNQSLKKNTFKIDDKGVGANYTLVYEDSLQVKVVADEDSVIDYVTSLTEVVYKTFNKSHIEDASELQRVLDQFKFTYKYNETNGRTIDATRFTITKVEIAQKDIYSTGEFLKVGKYTLTFTIQSKDFTFGNPLGNLGDTYTTTFTKQLEVTKKELTIQNAQVISKNYDGNANLLPVFINQNVNAAGGYYASKEALDGDIITVLSGQFGSGASGKFVADAKFGTGKAIDLKFDSDNDDSDNYEIKIIVEGNITAVELYFNRVGDTQTDEFKFVDDGITTFTKGGNISIQYAGDLDDLIRRLLAAERIERVGYTCVGYHFRNASGTVISTDSTIMSEDEKAAFLQAAVDAKKTGLEIYAIWERNTYDVTVQITNAVLTNSNGDNVSTLIAKVPYYNTLEDGSINYNVTANPGYKFTGINATEISSLIEAKVVSGQNNRNAIISLEKIKGNCTLKITISEINVRIVIDPQQRAGFTVSTDNVNWISEEGGTRHNVWDRTLTFTELLNENLPVVVYDRGYFFTNWTLKTIISEGTNLWERINGQSLTTDVTSTEFTFVANWQEATIFISFTNAHSTIEVYDLDSETPNVKLEANAEGKYKTYFSHDIKVVVNADNFYKWTDVTVTNGLNETIEDTEVRNNKLGGFKIVNIQTNNDITITSSPIKYTFKTNYEVPAETEIAEANNSINGEFFIEVGGVDNKDLTLADMFRATYTPAVGTYTQTAWSRTTGNKTNDFALNKKITEVILAYSSEGSLDKDTEITLNAFFTGVEYSVTFVNTDTAHYKFASGEAGSSVTKTVVYGSILTTVPDLVLIDGSRGEDFVWLIMSGEGADRKIETFENGQQFVSHYFRSTNTGNYTLRLESAWGFAYKITVNVTGTPAAMNKLVGIDGKPYTGGIELTYFNGVERYFNFEFEKGYEILGVSGFHANDTFSFKGDELDSRGRKNYLLVSGFETAEGETENKRTITVEIGPKSYDVTIETSKYYEFADTSVTAQFSIKYDEDIRPYFATRKLVRDGFNLVGLSLNGTKVASFDGSFFTFNAPLVYEDDVNTYCYDEARAFTLTPIWERKSGAEYTYFAISTNGKTGLVYNSSEQIIASSWISINGNRAYLDLSNQPTNINPFILSNGEQIVELYYVVNGTVGVKYNFKSTTLGADKIMELELLNKDVISGKAYIYVKLVDSLTSTDAGREITSTPTDIAIAKANIALDGTNLESYYTGTSTYVPTATDKTLGRVIFDGVTPKLENSELIIEKVEIVDETGAFAAIDGKNYSVKYYFRKNNFNSANYVDGIFADETATTITYQTSIVTTTIKKTPISLIFAEQGFYKETAHKVNKVDFEILADVRAVVKDKFIVTIDSVYTKGSDEGPYNTIEQFVITASVYTNESSTNLLSNFEFVLANGSSFSIISLDNTYTVNIGARYFNSTTLNETNDENNIVKILSFEYNNITVSAGDGDMNYMTPEGLLVLSIVKNGDKDLRVIVGDGRVVKFNLEIATLSPMSVLKWTSLSYGNNENDKKLFVEGLVDTLNTLKESDIKLTADVTTSNETTYVAVITDYKAVELSLDDVLGPNGETSLGYTYVRLGGEITISDPEVALGDIAGFEFANWSGEIPNVTINGFKVRAEENAGIYSCKLTAIWTLETPDITAKNYNFDADVAYGAIQTVTLNEILTNGIVNYNEQITYEYRLVKGGVEIAGTADKNTFEFTLPRNSTSTGDYYLTVTAISEGRTNAEREVKSTITVNLLRLTSVAFETTTDLDYTFDELVYSNRDFVPNILVTITGGGLGQYALADLLDNKDSSYRFNITWRRDSSSAVVNTKEIKIAGIYSINLEADSTIFDTSAISENQLSTQVTVAKREIVISINDIPSTMRTKLFGDNDPARFIFTKNMFAGDYTQTAYIELFRTQGENQGVYAFRNPVAYVDSNYATIDNNFSVVVDETAVYTIEKADIIVTVAFEDSTIAKVYDKKAPKFTLTYALDGEWYVYIDNNKYSKLIFSYEYTNGTVASLQDTFKALVLENMTITSTVIDAGTYGKDDMAISGDGNFAGYKLEGGFVINQRLLLLQDNNPIYKEFDRTDVIGKTDAHFTNIVEGDEVYMTGYYEKETVGLYSLEEVALGGKDAKNYCIPNPAENPYSGTIIPRKDTGNITFTITETNFIYGDINTNVDISEILKLVGTYTLTMGDVTTDLEKGYVTISEIRFETNETTAGNNLKAGENRKIIFVITSPNFELLKEGYEYGRGNAANAIFVNIDKRPLDLSGIPAIYKSYDTTNRLPAEVGDYDISSFARQGDAVYIDHTKGGFDDADIGINKHITLVLGGADASNYTVKDNITGVIAPYIIDITVETETEHATLVNGGRFVNDGESASRIDTFKVSYPFDASVTAESTINGFAKPTRKGYDFKGWYIEDGNGGYTVLDQNNIESVLHSIALNPNVEDALTVYAGWEIQVYALTLNYNNVEKVVLTANPQTAITENDGVYYVKYYTDVEIKYFAERGYKILAHTRLSGEAAEVNLGDTSRIESIVTIKGIASNFALQTTLDEIQITFAINTNIPDFSVRTDGNNIQPRLYYSLLGDKTEADLPALTVTEGTYALENYTYYDSNNSVYKLFNGKTLQEIVDEVYPTLAGDSVIILRANWLGELYTITFNPNGGIITGTNKREVRFGDEIVTFPVVKNPGKYPVWQDVNGRVYEEGNRLSSIGTKENGGYTLTLTATWENDTFDLVVTFDDGVIVTTTGGNQLANGDIIQITYNDPAIRIKVDVIKGYEYNFSSSSVNGTFVDLHNGEYSFQNLIADSTIHFTRQPANNTLSLRNTNIDGFEVKVDGIVVNPNYVQGAYQVIAKTEQEVTIVYTAKKGYEFEEGNTYDFLTDGSGSEGGFVSATISEDKKTLTIVWNGFVTGASINARAVPSINMVEFGDVREIFALLTFNSNNMNLSGGSFPIKTGSTLVIEGVMAFGYNGGNLSTGDNNYVVEGSVQNTYENGEKYYRFRATVEGFDEGFTITFTGTPRIFKFSIGIVDGEEAYGEITCDTLQDVKYRDFITLAQRELIDNYEFICWQIGDRVISTDASIAFEVNDNIEDELTAAGENGVVEIKAHYARKVRDITLTSTGKGGFVASQASENVRVDVYGTVTHKFYLGENLVIDLVPNEGYELSYIIIDGNRVSDEDNEKYEYDGHRFVIGLDLENPIESLEVVFKPCDIYVNVQAGTIINFIPNLGSAAGGSVYLTDAQGDRLGEDAYLSYNGEVIVGANYRFLSHTDDIIYLEIKAKTGFSASIVINTPGVTVSEFKKADGTKINIITGAKEGTNITVLFTAQENSVKILFSNDGEDIRAVHGGVFVVDTSSALVSSSPTRGDNVNIAVVTGEGLNVAINTLSSYYLVTNPDGSLKYDIIYSSEEEFSDLTIGKVENEEPLMSGYNNSSSISIGRVNVSATIVIYVKPIDYTIKFVVDDGVAPIVMSQTVRYGDEWTLDSLTAEQRALVFAEKQNYTFTGYYTGTNSYGTQYIDRYGEVTQNWQHSGYFYNGSAWQEEQNYDSVTKTFTLYAGWTFNNARVKVEVSPEIAINETFSVHSYIANINEVGAFVGQDDIWLATAAVGETLRFVAPAIPGYTFAYFAIKYNDGDYSNRGTTFDLLLEMGDYNVRAVYNPNFTITVENANNDEADGGTSYLKQENNLVSGNFDSSKFVSLFAKPAEGYAFLYWIDNATGAKIYGEANGEGEYVYTYDEYLYKPLNLTAVFKGKEVEVTFNASDLGAAHIIRGVLVNGEIVDYTKPFTAYVGDTIVVRVSKVRGYGFGDSIFTSAYDDANNYYVFSYVFKVEDLEVVEEGLSYKVQLTIPVTLEDITIKFNANMADPIDNAEIAKSGSFEWINSDESRSKIENGGTRTVKYGDSYAVIITAQNNYRYENAFLVSSGITFDISGFIVDGRLVINKDFIDRFFDYEININVYFARMLWIDEDVIAEAFEGLGTDEDPYLITNAKEFALLAYLVNNGIENEEGKLYSECSYVVTSDINFDGRYWVPVGTEENPFKGKIDLGGYRYDNVVHYTSYPGVRYGGLFWYIDENAIVIQSQKTFTVMIVCICVSVLLLIILIILFILWARRRKKKLEKLSNQ